MPKGSTRAGKGGKIVTRSGDRTPLEDLGITKNQSYLNGLNDCALVSYGSRGVRINSRRSPSRRIKLKPQKRGGASIVQPSPSSRSIDTRHRGGQVCVRLPGVESRSPSTANRIRRATAAKHHWYTRIRGIGHSWPNSREAELLGQTQCQARSTTVCAALVQTSNASTSWRRYSKSAGLSVP